MEAWQINRMLYRLFCNYNYKLHNCFVYAWESDFFAVSSSSYCVEVEVKVSRGDYFRDFDKEKHLLFSALQNKKSHYLTKWSGQGDKIGSIRIGTLEGAWDANQFKCGWWSVMHNGKRGYWVNDNTDAYIQWSRKELRAPVSGIHFHKVEGKACPNQLYFACPKDLIKLEEIPCYAGLIYCDGDAKIIRRAPYLHKVKQDMRSILLNKFYNLWHYKTDLQQKIEITGQYNLFLQSLNQPPCRADLL